MPETNQPSKRLTLSTIADTLEHLRAATRIEFQDWYDVLQMRWEDYQDFKVGRSVLPARSLMRVADHFALEFDNILSGKIDFKALTMKFEEGDETMPGNYLQAAHGRRRTSITSVDFLEARHGWRLRMDVTRKLGVSETALSDPFAPISMQFITDLCSHLHRRQFRAQDFFDMGTYSYVGNKDSLVSKLFSELRTPAEVYELWFTETMKLFERNCFYTIKRMGDSSLTLDVLSRPDVAADMGVRHLGNEHVCSLKAGMFAIQPKYLDLPPATVRETKCVHKGDEVCRFEIDFAHSNHVLKERISS